MGAIRYAAPPYFTDVMFHYCVADAPSGLYAVRIGSGCNSVQRRGSARFLGRTKADLDLRAWLHHRVSHAGREQYGIHCVKVHHHCIRAAVYDSGVCHVHKYKEDHGQRAASRDER